MGHAGLAVIVFGVVDYVLRIAGIDLWREHIGWTDMPELLSQNRVYAEIGLGFLLRHIHARRTS